MKRITLVISGDATYDQRIQKVCNSLVSFGYSVCLVDFPAVKTNYTNTQTYRRVSLSCLFRKGFLHYAEVNLRLFSYLIFCRTEIITANDVETLIPVYLASVLRKKKRVVDMHELFLGMEQMSSNKFKLRFWAKIEAVFLPKFCGYTVSSFIADHYQSKYGIRLEVVPNYPRRNPGIPTQTPESEKYLLYQGVITVGRCFEEMILAAKETGYRLVICGNGIEMNKVRKFIQENNFGHVVLKGWVAPDELRTITENAWIGLNLLSDSLNHRLTCANRFFDYIQAGLPQISSKFPVYEQVVDRYECALLIPEVRVEEIVESIRKLENQDIYKKLRQNALNAAEQYIWERNESILKTLFMNL